MERAFFVEGKSVIADVAHPGRTGSAEADNMETENQEPNQAPDVAKKPARQVHMCMECGDILSNASSLKRHTLTHTGVKAHQCEFCDKRFAHAYLLSQHLNMHSGDRPFQCFECKKSFAKPAVLKRHMLIHEREPRQCHHCAQQFTRNEGLDKHLANEHGLGRNHLCLVCGDAFTFETMLQEHIAAHTAACRKLETRKTKNMTKSEVLTPEKADETSNGSLPEASPYFPVLNQSVPLNSEDNEPKPKKDAPVVCPQCSKTFSRADSLRRHMIGVHERRSIPAKAEEELSQDPREDMEAEPVFDFPESSAVVRHKIEEDGHPCERCGMTFATDDLLKTHVLVVHPPTAPRPEHHSGNDAEGRQDNAENNNHSPPSENKTAANAPTVSSADMGSEPVFCIGCKTNFEDGAEFQDHLLTCGFDDEESKEADVSPERPAERKTPRPRTPRQTPGKSPRGPQKCQECGKQFADNYCLRRHMISHTGEKNHTCDVCGKKFAHSFHLTNHKRIHLGIKNFGCEVCGRTFTVNHALQRHLLTHPGTVAHACLVCDKKFASASGLRKHEQLHVTEDAASDAPGAAAGDAVSPGDAAAEELTE